jgi:hypothetical protein
MIVYVNGDSYTKISDGKRYSDFLSEHLNCPSVNAAISGSSNGRILRTSLRDLIKLKQTHDEIVAVISLTFPLRTEIWDPDVNDNRFVNDGEFVSIQTTQSKRWFYDNESVSPSRYQGYIGEWLRWYNIEAETVQLLKEILLLTTWCKHSKIKYVIFSGTLQEKVNLESPFIQPFYLEVSKDTNIIDIFTNSFTEWCISRGHIPIDEFTQEIHGTTYIIGHHGEAAHRDFANFLFENYLGTQ